MTRAMTERSADRRDVLNIAAALVAVLLLAGLASSAGCAHLSPEERFAVDTTVSIGKDCVAAPGDDRCSGPSRPPSLSAARCLTRWLRRDASGGRLVLPSTDA